MWYNSTIRKMKVREISLFLKNMRRSIHLSISQSTHLSIHKHLYRTVNRSTHLPIHLFIHPSILRVNHGKTWNWTPSNCAISPHIYKAFLLLTSTKLHSFKHLSKLWRKLTDFFFWKYCVLVKYPIKPFLFATRMNMEERMCTSTHY